MSYQVDGRIITGIVSIGFLAALAGCTKSGTEVPTMPTQPQGAVPPAEPPVAPAPPAVQAPDRCPDGNPFQAVSGLCAGSWRVVPTGSAGGGKPHYLCYWTWKPVSCKTEGFRDTGSAQCYGIYTQDVGARLVPVAQCSTRFGNPPQRVNYNLSCCK